MGRKAFRWLRLRLSVHVRPSGRGQGGRQRLLHISYYCGYHLGNVEGKKSRDKLIKYTMFNFKLCSSDTPDFELTQLTFNVRFRPNLNLNPTNLRFVIPLRGSDARRGR